MTVKELIAELQKYDENIDITLCPDINENEYTDFYVHAQHNSVSLVINREDSEEDPCEKCPFGAMSW